MRNSRRAPTTQAWRAFVESNLFHSLYVEDAGGVAAGGGSSPAASGAPAASSAPNIAAPAGSATPTPVATDGGAGSNLPGTPAAKTVGEAGGEKPLIAAGEEPKPTEKPTADEQRAYLLEKGGKAEDLAKLSEADLQAKFDEAKASEGKLSAADIKVKLPDDFTVDDKVMGEFQGVMADEKLTPVERAQKLMDMHVSALRAAQQAPMEEWKAVNQKWQAEVKADKEIGGSNFDTTRSTIAKAITDVGGAEAKQMFDAFLITGAANNPAIVRLMYRMSSLLVEPKDAATGKPVGKELGGKFEKSVAAMYPSASNGIGSNS